MIAHVTAAALATENKSLAHPASVDSLPTSANQEDHVRWRPSPRAGWATWPPTAPIVAIELLAAAQGIDFRRPLKTSPRLREAQAMVRRCAPFYDRDRLFAPDIEAVAALIQDHAFVPFVGTLFD